MLNKSFSPHPPRPLTHTDQISERSLDLLTKLNLGCGRDCHPDFINLDLAPFPGVDLIHDLQTPWPFPNDRFTEIHANQVLEHCEKLIFVMNQAFRVLRRGGTYHISVPWWAGAWQRGDPQHCRQFDQNSFLPFSQWHANYKHQGIKGPWKLVTQTYDTDPAAKDPDYRARFGFSIIIAMHVILEKP